MSNYDIEIYLVISRHSNVLNDLDIKMQMNFLLFWTLSFSVENYQKLSQNVSNVLILLDPAVINSKQYQIQLF